MQLGQRRVNYIEESKFTPTINYSALRVASVILCLIFAMNTTLASTYYVDASAGNDINPGTEVQPWKTVAKAAGIAGPGDTVLVKAGIYNEPLKPLKSGQPGARITFKAYPGHKVVLDGRGLTADGVHLSVGGPKKYIRIEGFEITNWTSNGIYFQGPYDTGVEGIEIVNNYIHHNLGSYSFGISAFNAINCLFEGNEITANAMSGIIFAGIGFKSDGLVIRGNHIHSNLKDGIEVGGTNIIIENNLMHSQFGSGKHEDGLDIQWLRDSIIRNNVIYDFTQLIYLALVNGPGTVAENVQIYGNILYNDKYWTEKGNTTPAIFADAYHSTNRISNLQIHSNTFGWLGRPAIQIYGGTGQAGSKGLVTGIFIRNNIMVDSEVVIGIADSGEVDSDYNIYYTTPGSTDRANPWKYEGPHSIFSDPKFVNYQRHVSYDFHLQPTSPAIDRADPALATLFSLPVPFLDLEGNARPVDIPAAGRDGSGAFDMGAYEFGSSGPGGTVKPTANAGPDQTSVDADGNGTEQFSLDGSGSFDPDGTIVSYIWTENGNQLASGVSAVVSLPVGEHTITLTVTDEDNLTATDEVVITLEPKDEIPPSVNSLTAFANHLEIQFNEPLDRSSAENISNYAISNGISITSASLNAQLNLVRLSTSPYSENTTYTLTVSGIKDIVGNSMAQTTLSFQYDSSLTAYWRLDDAGGTTARDSSDNGNNAVLINAPSWTAGKFNGAIDLESLNQAVEVSTTAMGLSGGTIVLWACPSSFPNAAQFIFGHVADGWNNRIQIYTNNGVGALGIGLGDTHQKHTDIYNLAVNNWYQIVLTWNGTAYAVYVNGVQRATGTYTGLSTLSSYADIGNTGYSADRYEAFNGSIDDVRIYSRALSAGEVSELFDEQQWLFGLIGDKFVDENEQLKFGVDVYNKNVTVQAEPLPAGASFLDNAFTWIPSYDQSGSYNVDFIATDGQLEDIETITITVNNVNRSPVLDDISNKQIDEGDTLTFTLNASDPDGDTITYSAGSLPLGAALDGNIFSWTPLDKQAGTYVLNFAASDGELVDTESVVITVNHANRAPVLSAIGNKTVDENSSLEFVLRATDLDGDAITFSAQTLPSGAVLSGDTFTWTPTYDQAGSYQITFVASDGSLEDSETITITVNNVTPPQPDTNSGLIGYWKFDDNSGPIAADSSGSGNTGVLINSPTWTAGKIGGAVDFTASAQAVEVGTNGLSTSAGSIVLWACPTALPGTTQFLFGHVYGGWANRIQIYTNNTEGGLGIGLGDTHVLSGNIYNLATEKWYQIVLTWNGTDYTVYVDGIQQVSGTYTGLNTLSTYAAIGNTGYRADSQEAFNGVIDEIRLYNRAVSADEVSVLYDAVVSKPPVDIDSGLIGHWKLDEGSGIVAADSSGTGNTGTLIEGPTWTTGKFGGAISLTTPDQAVEIGTSDLGIARGTVSLWAYPTAFPDAAQFMFGHVAGGWKNRIQIYTNNTAGGLGIGLGNRHKQANNIYYLPLKAWSHIVLTWDGLNYVVYVDGLQREAGSYNGLSTLSTYADIGNTGYRPDRHEAFSGVIDDVRIYNRVLGADEVLYLFSQ